MPELMDDFLSKAVSTAKGAPADDTVTANPIVQPERSMDDFLSEAVAKSQGTDKTFYAGSKLAPEQSAKILDIQKRTGLPPAFIERNLEPIKQKMIQADTREFAKLNPSTGAWLAESPYNTALVQDDFENMGAMERLTNIVKPVPALAASGIVEAGAGAVGLFGFNEYADKLRADITAVRSQVAQENPLEPGSWSEATRSALTSIYSQAPAYAIGLLTGGATLPLTMFGTQAGFQKVSELEAGGVGKLGTVTGGVISGISEAATEAIPFGSLLGKKIVKFFLTEQFGEQINTAVDSIIDKVSIEPDMTWADYMGRIEATAKTTLIQSGLMGGGMGAVKLATRKSEQPSVTSEKQLIEELGKLAESSKLRERSPEKFQEAMQRLFKGTKAENVYIPVEAWETYWQEKGVEPSVMAQEMGISPDAYTEAVANRGALQVATDAYIRKIGPTEHNAFFAEEVKLRPEGMNAREFKAFMENPEAFTDSAQQITDEVTRQLVATGKYSEEDAKLQAEALYGSVFKTLGERVGVDPMSLYRAYNLKVGTDKITQAMTGGKPGQYSQPTEDVIKSPEFKAWFGDSKVVNENGEPLVVYHSTAKPFDAFDSEKTQDTLFWFTSDKGKLERGEAGAAGHGEIMPVYLSAKKLAGYDEYDRFSVDELIAQGYDGLRFDDDFVVFNPTQIKSVFNRGTFDPEDARILYQKSGKGPRGQITFGPKGVNIALLKNADPSTFIHETAHFYLRVLGDLAGVENTPSDLKADYQTILNWLNVKEGQDINVEQHEQFARGFEAYLFEGKAPSAALRSAFARFKTWLMEVYKTLSRLNVELTPEVKGVFDRLMASQGDITAIQSEAENTVIDLVTEGRDAESVTDEEIARLVPAYKPQPASEVKGQVREATGLKRTFEYIREDKALEAAWKKAEQSARIAFKAGKAEEAAKWKEKMAEVVTQANEKVAKIMTEKQRIARRRQSINTIVEYLGLTDAQVKKLTASKKDIRLMTDWEFKQFKDELLVKAVELQETNFAKARVAEVIERKHLKNSENYSAVLGYPSVNEMTTEQLHEWADILDMFADGDVFLTERKLELVDRTDLEGIRTWREVKEKLAEKAGVSIEELNNIKVSHLNMFRWDNALADQNPFYGLLVEKVTKTMMNAEMRAHDIETRIYELAKKSDKSRERGIVGRIIPQDKQIFAYLEAPASEKGALAAEMTPEQIDLAHYIQEYFAQALEYLIKTKSLEKGRENYFVHIRRSVLENIKEDGIVKAMKEVYRNYQQDEMVFGILDDATGRILPNEKFFQFSMRRTGALDPTYNVVKAFLTYAKTFEKKVALDAMLPELDLYAQALTPLHMTPRGLEIDRSLKDFVYKYINNKKGRQVGFDKVISQGSPADLALRGLRAFTTMLDLGFSIPVGMGTYVGEQAANLVMLGPKDMAKGTARIKTAKGKAILDKYEAFVGRSMWQEFTAPGKEITDNIMTGLFGFFHSSTVLANKQYLLGSLTEQEYNSGEISPERLAQMKIDMGRFRVVPGTKSIFGSTSLGSAVMQYKSWAAGILRTTTKDLTTMMKDIKNKPVGETLTTREAHEIYRIIALTTTALIVFGMGDEEDKSFIGRLRWKVRSESLSMISALSPLFWTGYPRIWTFMKQLAGNVQALILMEEYKTKPGLKGLEGLKKQFTPGALRGITTEDEPRARR